jgi:hypothetical protein
MRHLLVLLKFTHPACLVLLLLSLSLLLLLPGAKEFVPWDQVGTRVPELLEQIQVGAAFVIFYSFCVD